MSTRRIVVGVDGSEGAEHALNWCVEYARSCGQDAEIEFLVVHALSPAVELTMALPLLDFKGWWEAVQRELRDKWCAPLSNAGVHYRPFLIDDYPARALMQVAEEHHAELIVVGTHGHGGFTDRLTGGVSIKLLQHARTPVVVVPPER